ncbi:MAG: FHA domain-containing protein, partial [Vicinamibacterales bacterium]
MPRLVVFRGDSVESEIRLTGGPVRVGRHARNDVVLDDTLNGVSRFHAEIRPEGNSYVIADLNSRNGVWIGGRKIKDKAALQLGVPVTVGAFELVLEDDASGTFDSRVASPRTVLNAAAISDTGASGRSAATASGRSGVTASSSGRTAAPARQSPTMSATTRQTWLWSGVAAGVLLICGVTYAVVRYRSRPPTIAEVAVPVAVAPTTPVEPSPPPAPEDPNKALNDEDLAAAHEMVAANNYAGALRDHLQPLLERDPENAAALELKRQVDEAIEAAAKSVRRAVPKPETPAEVETPGVARKAGEAYADYTARVRQLQANLDGGKTALDKHEYAVACARFRLGDRDAPKYQGVDALIADTLAKQQKAVDTAIDNGQQNEQA